MTGQEGRSIGLASVAASSVGRKQLRFAGWRRTLTLSEEPNRNTRFGLTEWNWKILFPLTGGACFIRIINE